MGRIKNWAETTILISVFAAFFTASLYVALIGNERSMQLSAIAVALFCAKSAVLVFCRSSGLLPGHKVQILSYKATAFCIWILAIAIVLKYIS